MTDDEYHAAQQRARACKALMEDPAWVAAYEAVHAAVLADWSNAAWGVPEVREQKFAEMKGLQMVRDRMTGWINDAKFEFDRREKRVGAA